ncbi:c-type cytochrome domain-containing protein [Flavihumibacter fluvii]|uniref:c-type cytochrome domain-containing protein n=1 Tax=Flavihumibacter fluvii TaxID=2838157 RepID=UPI001BDE3E7A|nr:c-type cytochrome domain-containing protein [Flavihumibacter fluvii]ULQ54758.1 chitobiase/beta-hexosaminidase C-terminal domain-containing protein [Flavihumibacter fluvii]
MNQKVKLYAEQLLIVLNFFIAFLLLFDNKLVLPYWLQPVGRMHPMLLHFPIVLVILALGMELFRSGPGAGTSNPNHKLARGFLLGGALLSGITVIMGLFLSREEGYAGDTLVWHKWTGVCIFFIASVIYWAGNKRWFTRTAAWVSAVVMFPALLLTGHYGAALSHGEDFILEPIIANQKAPVVPIEQAIVFDHVIQPILARKCAGCHNANKLKGQLALTDSLSLLKGGKSGKLFVPGDPEISLLLERVHLSLDEKKHMPPAGKPQLTNEEISLLALWIKENADFHQKVTDRSEDDSLRLLATAVLQPEEVAEQFDFSAADAKTIAKLNTFDRSISPIARESPALDVNIYNKSTFSAQQLKELDPIRKQVVSLSLNKMPVKDEDLNTLSQFENLRRLDLNFTEITDKALDALIPLKYLHTLSVSGTKLSYAGMSSKIAKLKNIKTISIWNTGITSPEVEQLRRGHKDISFIEGFKDEGKDPLKLNPPQVKNALMVFNQDMSVQLRHPIKGVQIRFTTDGTEPDSIRSPVFDGNTVINKNTTVKAKAFKEGWYSSDVATFDFLKNSFIPDSVQIVFPLNPVHKAEGANTFFNKKLGVIGANNPAWANYWAGARDNDMVLVSIFYKPVTVSSVGLHYMLEQETGIYPPALVEVWGGENAQQAKLLLTIKPPLPAKGEKPSLKMVEGAFKPHTVSYLKIIAKPLKIKKDQHLLLVDEMFLN